jgi:predicted ATPase
LRLQGNNLVLVGGGGRPVDPTFLPARGPFNAAENAQWFSDLRKVGEEDPFIKAMREQFPDIVDVSPETELGVYSIHVQQRSSKRRVPVSLISDGMNKLMSMLLRIAHSSRTATFFDEVENGIHFSRQERMWRQLLAFAKEYKTQVFASTHSLESIRAAVPVIKQNAKDFTLVRTFRQKEVGAATLISGKEALNVIASGLEVR